MVMRPDVWGRALDAVLAEAVTGVDQGGTAAISAARAPCSSSRRHRAVLHAGHGSRIRPRGQTGLRLWSVRGIDSRVAEHYRGRLEVREVSVGDVVIAGGEAVAAGRGRGRRAPAARSSGQLRECHDDSPAPEREGGPWKDRSSPARRSGAAGSTAGAAVGGPSGHSGRGGQSSRGCGRRPFDPSCSPTGPG